MRSPRIIWVQELRCFFILVCLLRSFFFQLTVYYDENRVRTIPLLLLRVLDSLSLGGCFKQARLSFDCAESGDECLAYGIRDKVEECLEAICRKYSLTDDLRRKNMVKCFLYDSIYKRVSFIEMVRNHIRRCRESGEEPFWHIYPGADDGEILLKGHSLNVFIAQAYRSIPLAVKSVGMRGEKAGIALRLLAYLPYIVYGLFFYRGVLTNISLPKPSVWVEFEDESGIDFTFWREHFQPDQGEIVHFLFRGDTRADIHNIRVLEERGYKWVDAHFLPALSMSGFGLKALVGVLRHLWVDMCRYPLLITYLFFLYNLNYSIYSALFRRFQVRIMIQHHDTFWMQELWARAVEAAGGILMGFHWSHYPAVMPQNHLFPFHVFFVWGEAISRFIAPGGHTCHYILPSGLWLQDRRENNPVAELNPKLDFVLACFDSSAAYNLHQTEETLSQFYLWLLDLIERQPTWGVIVKSKNWRAEDMTTLRRGELIVAKMKGLSAVGRLRVLSPDVSPLHASVQAHLSVCYGLNSAGIVSALHGCRAVYWDASRWHRHPFYNDSEQRFAFRSLDELEQAILQAAAGDDKVGDFSRWCRSYNYFGDHEAPRRVGRFMGDVMTLLNESGDASTSLRLAAERYIREHDVRPPFYNLCGSESTVH